MTHRQKKNLIRIIIALVAFGVVMVLDKTINLSTIIDAKYGWFLTFGIYFVIYIFIGYDVLKKAFLNIIHGQMLDENFLMCVATIGAFSLAIYKGFSGDEIEGFDEACAVLLFYQVGEWFQSYAVGKSRKSISTLMDIRPDYANLYKGEEVEVVSPEEVNVDEVILINPGEKIPLDGIVIEGASSIDTKALTGESIPRDVTNGSEVISGCVNLTSTIKVKVTKAFYDSTVSKILDLVENASNQKSKTENFITKFARIYTPTVVTAALFLAIIPSLITKDWGIWIYRALSFLVVSCPCALVISIPLSFFAGIGAASRYGILIKGSNYLEIFNKANIFVFDKTGTLTKGNFKVSTIIPENSKDEILKIASYAEEDSSHPIAKSIVLAYGKKIDKHYTKTNVAGKGIIARLDNDVILCGNEKLMEENNIEYTKTNGIGSIIYVAHNNKFLGSILIVDEIKDEARITIDYLNKVGKTIMLTGDNELIAKNVSKELNLTSYKSSLLPQDKVIEVEKLINNKNKKELLCFTGDGINDAPVLMRADIGISMGQAGSDAAIEASDIVLMKDDLTGIMMAKKISKKTMRIVWENIIFALGVKLIILILSAIGITNMWVAVFGDVGVAVIAILNAMRTNSKYK